MQDRVHGGVVKIIKEGLEAFFPRFCLRNPEWTKQLNTVGDSWSAQKKETLLTRILDEEGAQALLSLGKILQQDQNIPLVYVLLNSDSPRELATKLEHFYQYFHSDKRIVLVDAAETHLAIRHISVSGQKIAAAEDFFTAGILLALLEKIGCQQIILRWVTYGDQRIGTDHVLDSGARKGKYSEWHFGWQEYCPAKTISGLDQHLLQSTSPVTKDDPVEARVHKFLATNLSGKMQLADVAHGLGMSERTLQRRLSEAKTTFRKIYHQVRLDEAEKLLLKTDLTLTEIGYITGFADYAHFCRQFTKHSGVNPSTYRLRRERDESCYATFQSL